MALTAQHRVLLADADGNSYGGTLPQISELAAIGGWTPNAHTHAPADITGTAVVTADARLADDRKPGFVAGDGGAVTQATSKATGVTLNERTGRITMTAAALAAGAVVSFTLTNSFIGTNDIVVLNHAATGTNGVYLLNARPAAGSASIAVRNTSASSLSEAIVIAFAVIKGVIA